MTRKKVFALACAAVFAVCIVVGCSSQTEEKVNTKAAIVDVEEIVELPMPQDVEEIVVRG